MLFISFSNLRLNIVAFERINHLCHLRWLKYSFLLIQPALLLMLSFSLYLISSPSLFIIVFSVLLWSLSFTFSSNFHSLSEQHITQVCRRGSSGFAYGFDLLQIVTSIAPHWCESLERSQSSAQTMRMCSAMSRRQPFWLFVTWQWACKIHSRHSHCSSLKLNGATCVGLS